MPPRRANTRRSNRLAASASQDASNMSGSSPAKNKRKNDSEQESSAKRTKQNEAELEINVYTSNPLSDQESSNSVEITGSQVSNPAALSALSLPSRPSDCDRDSLSPPSLAPYQDFSQPPMLTLLGKPKEFLEPIAQICLARDRKR